PPALRPAPPLDRPAFHDADRALLAPLSALLPRWGWAAGESPRPQPVCGPVSHPSDAVTVSSIGPDCGSAETPWVWTTLTSNSYVPIGCSTGIPHEMDRRERPPPNDKQGLPPPERRDSGP